MANDPHRLYSLQHGRDVAKPEEVIPLDERVDNIPYRGEELHGVPFEDKPMPDELKHWRGTVPTYVEEPKEVNPIPVKIVTEKSDEIKNIRAKQVPIVAGDPASQIINRNINRRKVTIKNITGGAGPAFITGENNATTMSGFPIFPGETLAFESTEPVWAVSPLGCTLAILGEVVE